MQKFLRLPGVCKRYDRSPSTLYYWMSKGQFPKPVRFGVRAVGWPIEELEKWERERAADRDRAA